MLSGEILSRPPLSVALVPPSNLIQLCRAMAAIASLAANQPDGDIDDVYLENGLLSYENPNYHMNAQRIERNSHLYEEILSELQLQKQQHHQHIASKSAKMAAAMANGGIGDAQLLLGEDEAAAAAMGGEEMVAVVQDKMQRSNRKEYAKLDVSAMGVDLKENFIAAEKRSLSHDDASPTEPKPQTDNQMSEKSKRHTGTIQKSTLSDTATSNTTTTTNTTTDNSGQGVLNVDDLYALPNKRNKNKLPAAEDKLADTVPECTSSDEGGDEKGNHEDAEDKDANKDLPPGWEKHEDNNGPYYWHIKSGTIQREPPIWSKHTAEPASAAGANAASAPHAVREPPTPSAVSIASTVSSIGASSFASSTNSYYNQMSRDISGIGMAASGACAAVGPPHRIQESQSMSVTRSSTSSALDQADELERRRKEELTYKRRSYPLKSDTDRPIRFAVRSMGWVEIAEEDLTPERSSKAVNKCIVDLSLGRNDLLDVVGRWGDGKDLFMDLDDGALKLIDPENLTILNTQPIHTIRVWGVGRDNGRDFAYVARDRLTRIHMCHVFRCDTTARTIANTLRDICKRIMIERSLQLDTNNGHLSGTRCATRPTDLPTENRQWIRNSAQSFPTPMEEPKKVLKAQYLGSAEVGQPTGIDVLNAAIDAAVATGSPEQWEHVNVAVAPSMISIYSSGPEGRLIAECRVRYLSFLGIGQNVKNCAFIMHTADDKFVCHTFTCEPSSGALCKTIEAACKLRYQKCLDAHPESRVSAESGTPNKGIGATIKTLMSSFTLKKDKVTTS